jgi:hypothetical protein
MENRWMNETTSAASPDPWDAFLAQGLLGSSRLIDNAELEFSAVDMDVNERWPVVTNRRGEPACSWVASMRNAYGPYARAETDLVGMNRWLRPLYLAGSHAAESLLVASGFSGGNYLNNWILATNLYRTEFSAAAIHRATAALCHSEPKLPVVVRSLTSAFHAKLMKELMQSDFLFLPSRQVWIVHDPAAGDWRRHRDPRRDLRLEAVTTAQWTWVSATDFTDQDYARALHLYQRLYRERYPRFNPDYTESFLRIGVATGFLDVVGLRRAGDQMLSGFVGMIHRAGVSATPLLGYDIDAPVELGLYRRLMLRAFRTCEARRTQFHCSAGAGLFKFNRGAAAHVEFAAVWANHLPAFRRANLRVLAAGVAKWAVPYLESHRL